MTQLKIYTERSYLHPDERHSQIFYPFWGENSEDPLAPTSGRYDRFVSEGRGYLELTAPESADLAVFPVDPYDWRRVAMRATEFAEKMRVQQLPAVYFFCGDSAEPLGLPECIVFRTSLYRSTRQTGEYALPAWSEDFVLKYLNNVLPIRQKSSRPVVGFCGKPGPVRDRDVVRAGIRRWAKKTLRLIGSRRIKDELRQQQLADGPFKGLTTSSARAQALKRLSQSRQVETNFQYVNGFFGGAMLPGGRMNYQQAQQARYQMVDNMVHSDYILCARGAGNFSYRLYETLCCGRIPIFVNTDCVLPYEGQIDWRNLCVWVEENELNEIEERVAHFHARLSATEFVDLQLKCRQIWDNWLSPHGFFSKLYLHFQSTTPNSMAV